MISKTMEEGLAKMFISPSQTPVLPSSLHREPGAMGVPRMTTPRLTPATLFQIRQRCHMSPLVQEMNVLNQQKPEYHMPV